MFGQSDVANTSSVDDQASDMRLSVLCGRVGIETTPKASITLILHSLRNCRIARLEQRFSPTLPQPNPAVLAALAASVPDPCPDRRDLPSPSPASSADRFSIFIKSAYLALTFRVDRKMYSDGVPGRSLLINNARLNARSVADQKAKAYVSYRRRPHVAGTASHVSMS